MLGSEEAVISGSAQASYPPEGQFLPFCKLRLAGSTRLSALEDAGSRSYAMASLGSRSLVKTMFPCS